jgi:hypothetical protein
MVHLQLGRYGRLTWRMMHPIFANWLFELRAHCSIVTVAERARGALQGREESRAKIGILFKRDTVDQSSIKREHTTTLLPSRTTKSCEKYNHATAVDF